MEISPLKTILAGNWKCIEFGTPPRKSQKSRYKYTLASSKTARLVKRCLGPLQSKGQVEVFWLDSARNDSLLCGEVRPQQKSVDLETGHSGYNFLFYQSPQKKNKKKNHTAGCMMVNKTEKRKWNRWQQVKNIMRQIEMMAKRNIKVRKS